MQFQQETTSDDLNSSERDANVKSQRENWEQDLDTVGTSCPNMVGHDNFSQRIISHIWQKLY